MSRTADAEKAKSRAYVASLVAESRRFSRMFEPEHEPSFRKALSDDASNGSNGSNGFDENDDDFFDDGGFFYDDDDDEFYDQDDASLGEKEPKRKAVIAPNSKVKRLKTQDGVASEAAAAASSSPTLQFDDMRTWKFARRRPGARRFRSNTVVGPVFVTKVKRDDGEVTVYGRRFLHFDGLTIADVGRDAQGEYFHLHEDPTYGEGNKKIRPSTPPDCDGDVSAERARLEQLKSDEREAREKERVRDRQRRRRRLEREARLYREALTSRVPETLHVGDFIKYENPVRRDGPLLEAQIVAAKDPSGRVPWTPSLPWTFDGPFASELDADTPVMLSRRRGQPVDVGRSAKGWLFPLSTFLAPATHEPPLQQSDMQRDLARLVRQGQQNVDNAVRDFLARPSVQGTAERRGGDDAELYPNLRL